MQETYARVLARPRLLRRDDDLAYLLRTMRNVFLSDRRRASRRPRTAPLPEDRELVERRPEGDPEAAFDARRVYEAIASLSEDFRDVLVAVDVAGLSYREAATALKAPEGTVMSRLHRARKQVIEALEA